MSAIFDEAHVWSDEQGIEQRCSRHVVITGEDSQRIVFDESCTRCRAELAVYPLGPLPVRVELTDDDLCLILEALDSHAYWQLTPENQRNDGHSQVEDGEDPEIDRCRKLDERLRGVLNAFREKVFGALPPPRPAAR